MTTLIVVIVAVVVVAVVVALVLRARRNAQLRNQFGPEYDRTVDESGKRAGVRELKDRQARHDELELTPLDPSTAQRLRDEWRLTQERFVDAPAESVAEAHRVLRTALDARGYPTRDDDDRVAMLSVDHADVLDRYRTGMATESKWREQGTTDTEDLRLAMQHYRAVFDRVVGETADAYPDNDNATTRDRDNAVDGRSNLS
jgi:hypothetical protein